MSDNPAPLSLRDRKKLQTREDLIDTALTMFTARGFHDVTLDEICDEVSVSKRTFFRTFTSKEDVAMAPTQDLWLASLQDLEQLPPSSAALIEQCRDALIRTIERTVDHHWTRRAMLSIHLAEQNPSIDAHGVRFCQQTGATAQTILRRRFKIRVADDLALRLGSDMLIAAFRHALADWALRYSAKAPADGSELAAAFRRTVNELPRSLALVAPPRHGSSTKEPKTTRRSP